jgi:hypothetical protein
LETFYNFYVESGSHIPELYSVTPENQDMIEEVCEELPTFLSLHIEYLILHEPYRKKKNSSSVVECVTVAVGISLLIRCLETAASSGFQFWGGRQRECNSSNNGR